MRTLNVVFAALLLLFPALAVGQAIPPVAEPLMQNPVEVPPPFFVAQGPPALPPPPGGPQLGPGGPIGHVPLGPPQPVRGIGPGPGAWWKESEVVKKLELSEIQVARIEQAYLEHRLRSVDLRADLEKQEIELQPLLEADRPDEAKVAARIDLITTARGKLEKEHAMMLLAIRRVLSVEQWKQLQALQQERGPGGRLGQPGMLPRGAGGFHPPHRPSPDVPR